MALGLSLRVFWICLLFSSAAGFPATKGDYRYPYTATWSSGGGPAAGSNLQSEGLRPSLASLQYEAAPQQASAPDVNQSPSSVGASSVAAGSSPSYEPYGFVTYGSSAPGVPSQGSGYVSPPVGTGTKTPGSSVYPQPSSGTSGRSNVGSVYEAAQFVPARNVAPTYSFDRRAPSFSAPTSFRFDEVALPYTNSRATYDFGDGPVGYGSQSDPGLPWVEQPAGGADASFYNFMPDNFPDFSVLGSGDAALQGASETSPLPPSSYIVQSRNGYQLARELFSNTQYAPVYQEPQASAYRAAGPPSRSPAETGSKGGRKF